MISETKSCQNCKNDFEITPDDFSFYEKMKVPAPTFCPECRNKRRLIWRNHRSLYSRECGLCKKFIITIYGPSYSFPVYCNECFYGDGWDPMDYAMDIDWSKPFLSQWYELWNKTPKYARLFVGNVKNSDYSNIVINSSDCYLSYSITESEQLMYSESIDRGKSLVDCYMSIEGCDSCYFSQGRSSYACKYSSQCASCINCDFCFDCVNCQDCFMSHGLRNKKYVFRGIQMSAQEYKVALEKENLKSRKNLDELFIEWKDMIEHKAIHQYARIVSGNNATGNYIKNVRNVKGCFNIYNSENISYGMRVFNAKDSHDVYGFVEGELIYDCVGCSYGSFRNVCSFYSMTNSDIYYSFLCTNNSNLFGCCSVSKKKNLILNKQYSQEEYEALVEKIKKHMDEMPYVDEKGRVYKFGDFVPFEFSPHKYNESIAFDFFPMNEKEAVDMGYGWYYPEEKKHVPTLTSNEIPDTIEETTDDILKQIIACKHSKEGKSSCNHQCTGAFKIHPDELLFYKKHNIPIPNMCPNCRHYERLPVFITPCRLYHRSCMHEGCNNEFETPYAPDRPEIVYCESCYQKEVI